MVAKAVIDKFTQIDPIEGGANMMTAPTIGGASAFVLMEDRQNGTGGTTSGATPGLHGGNLALASPSNDFTVARYVGFQMDYRSFRMPEFMETLANGGVTMYFIDGLGSHVGFFLSGSDIFAGTDPVGTWDAFVPMDNVAGGNCWFIDMSRTPDVISGSIDWTDIASIEPHINIAATRDISLYLGRLNVMDRPIAIGGEAGDPASMDLFGNYLGDWPNFQTQRIFASQGLDFMGSRGNTYVCLYGFEVGDGSTETQWIQDGGQLSCYASRDAQEFDPTGIKGYTCAFNGDGSLGQGRDIIINQSALDVFDVINFTYSGVEYQGEYSVKFTSTAGITKRHVSCIFDSGFTFQPLDSIVNACTFDGWEKVEIPNVSTNITSCTYQNSSATSEGFLIEGTGGDYSSVTCEHRLSNLGKSVTIDTPGASEPDYDITGQSIEAGHTLAIHNKSAVNALTVVISRAIFDPGDYLATTVGGSVTVATTPQTAGINLPTWSSGRVWLVNNTTASTVEEVTTGVGGYLKTWSNGVEFSAGDSGTAYFISTEEKDTSVNFIATADTTQVNLLTPETDTVYPYYMTVRGKSGEDVFNEGIYVLDGTNVQFDLNDPDGIYSLMEFYLWMKYARFITPGAIQIFWGGVVAVNTANLYLDAARVNGFFDNLQSGPARYDRTDGVSIVRSDGLYPAISPTTGGGAITVNEGDIQIVSQDLELLKVRFDISDNTTQKYANDGSSIASSEFTLTKTDNNDGTFSMAKS